ncbi:type II toxin-antitoxin system VapC family toxin [Coleofasciculus sp. H7-2]|uniref:type II toxin-antitoxin system VapC family toxin n=1 Tax=Coleofasciculus sp. H7-2 TaxID=3351545 RepID=UPI00366F6BBA
MALTEPLILLDTNIVLYYLGGRLTDPLPSGKYFISVITEIELLSYPSLNPDEEVQIRTFLTKIIIVCIDENIKELAIAFRKNHNLRLPDAIITATAQFLNATLLTNDARLVKLTEIKTCSVRIL